MEGNSFTGIWQHDKLHGPGTAIYANGGKFEGMFKDGMVRYSNLVYLTHTREIKGNLLPPKAIVSSRTKATGRGISCMVKEPSLHWTERHTREPSRMERYVRASVGLNVSRFLEIVP